MCELKRSRYRARGWLSLLVACCVIPLLSACSGESGAPPRDSAGDGDDDGTSDTDTDSTTTPLEDDDPTSTDMTPGEDSCPDCIEASAGPDGEAFDIDGNGDNVGLDPDGAIVLELGSGEGSKYIWIANTGEHTVSKVNVETFVEEGRYLLDSGVPGAQGGNFGTDPSRTSVNLQGDAFVGSRGGSALTRVSVLGEDCPDTNGDGVVTTSTDATFLPWGQDDCVMWQTQLSGKIRGVAAQDIPGETTIEPQPDGPPAITTTASEHYVWVGSNNDGSSSQLWKIDVSTGNILITMQPPTHVYGLAMSGDGLLYTTGGYHGGNVGWVDTAVCLDDVSCAVPVCTVACAPGACPADCDGSAVGLLDMGGGTGNFYGITVDCKQRVWVGAHNGGLVRRYDRAQVSADRLITVPGTAGVSGIATDRNGFVWGGRWSIGDSIRMDAETLAFTPVPNSSAHGVAIDGLGRVWHIPINGNEVTVTEPGPGLMDSTNLQTVAGFVSAYTYSDMTGEQLRGASAEPGTYRHRFSGCGEGQPTDWKQLVFDAELPDGTWLVFRARVASDPAGLEDADWVGLVAVPGVDSPVAIEDYLKAAGMSTGNAIEIEVELLTENAGGMAVDRCSGAADGATPRLKSLSLRHSCAPVVE